MGNNPDPQSREEIEAHLSSAGVRTADLCLTATVEYDRFDVTWYTMTSNLRLVLAQQWIWDVRGRVQFPDDLDLEELAEALAKGPFRHEIWNLFTHEQTVWLLGRLGDWWHRRVFESHPRMIDAEHELILFVDREAVGMTDEMSQGIDIAVTTPIENSVTVLVAFGQEGRGAQVAGFGDRPPVPGWPPDQGID